MEQLITKGINIKGYFVSLDVMHGEAHITNMPFLPKMFDLNLIMRKQT